MTLDDLFAHLAQQPKKNRPTELKSDSAFLRAWLASRGKREVQSDLLFRHNLNVLRPCDFDPREHEHAISNAWGWLVEFGMEAKRRKGKPKHLDLILHRQHTEE